MSKHVLWYFERLQDGNFVLFVQLVQLLALFLLIQVSGFGAGRKERKRLCFPTFKPSSQKETGIHKEKKADDKRGMDHDSKALMEEESDFEEEEKDTTCHQTESVQEDAPEQENPTDLGAELDSLVPDTRTGGTVILRSKSPDPFYQQPVNRKKYKPRKKKDILVSYCY